MSEGDPTSEAPAGDESTTQGALSITYVETDDEHQLRFDQGDQSIVLAQNKRGYAMVKVRSGDGDELERYYGFEMALDHVGEVLDVDPRRLSIPDSAPEFGI